MHNIINAEIKVSYVVALHLWMFGCMFFTFMGLVEFFLALTFDYIRNVRKKEENWLKQQQEQIERQPLAENGMTGTGIWSEAAAKVMNNNEPDHHSLNDSKTDPEKINNKKDLPADYKTLRVWKSMRSTLQKWRTSIFGSQSGSSKNNRRKETRDHNVNEVDAIARRLLPTCFFLFMICYFTYFQNYPNSHKMYS
jgi:hypothetical protein